MATKPKKNYSASDEVPGFVGSVTSKILNPLAVTPAPAPYKTNSEYLKEEAENREKMLQNKSYLPTFHSTLSVRG